MIEERNPSQQPLLIEKDWTPEYAILPRREYQVLTMAAEDGENIRLLAEVDADELEEDLTAEMVGRLVAGENPVRVWRQHRGLKGKELTRLAGIEQSHVS